MTEHDKHGDKTVADNLDNVNDPKQAIQRAKRIICTATDEQEENRYAVNINYSLPGKNICYLPMRGDEMPHRDILKPMGPIGPWATGKVDYSPMAGLTGTRPIVDRYSITRFSPNEWRAKNKEIIDMIGKASVKNSANQIHVENAVTNLVDLVEKTQKTTTEALKNRVREIGEWKARLETAIAALQDEISTMETERVRLKKSLVMIGIPESIAKECITIRSCRPESELVRDIIEEELINELAQLSEISQSLKKTLDDFGTQQIENRAARERLEYDWSDKAVVYEIDTVNAALNNHSKTIMFSPGAMRAPPEQASEHYWKFFSEETLRECEKTRNKSVKLRATLNSILFDAARDIRNQADIVEKAFIDHINCLQENETRFVLELKDCLNKLADTENRITSLHAAIASFDAAMKVAQTRMNNRAQRGNVENCRDKAQQLLINEVIVNLDGVEGLLTQLDEAEHVKIDLINIRGRLEREIMLKRKTLFLDRDRCMELRSHFPSANALKGNAA